MKWLKTLQEGSCPDCTIGPMMDIDMHQILTYKHENDEIPPLAFDEADSEMPRLRDVNFSCARSMCYTKDVLNEPMDYLFESIDLREAGLSTVAKYQGNCGSCWAFATAALLENLVLRSQRVIRQNESLRA